MTRTEGWRKGIVLCVMFGLVGGGAARAEGAQGGGENFLIRTSQFLDDVFKGHSPADGRVKVEAAGEFRYRLETRDDFNFNDAAFEDGALNLFRTRLGVKLQFGDRLEIFAQGQDSKSVSNRGDDRNTSFVNRLGLHQLYGEVSSPAEGFPLKVRAGRQKLAYGDERFVGAFEWSNVTRVFDAVKVVFEPAK